MGLFARSDACNVFSLIPSLAVTLPPTNFDCCLHVCHYNKGRNVLLHSNGCPLTFLQLISKAMGCKHPVTLLMSVLTPDGSDDMLCLGLLSCCTLSIV
jgi:hypothetical protein